MALKVEFGRRFTVQLRDILNFYDERNGSDHYSRRLMSSLIEAIGIVSQMPLASSPSTRNDVRFIYVMGFTVVFRHTTQKITMLSIRSSRKRPLNIYKKK